MGIRNAAERSRAKAHPAGRRRAPGTAPPPQLCTHKHQRGFPRWWRVDGGANGRQRHQGAEHEADAHPVTALHVLAVFGQAAVGAVAINMIRQRAIRSTLAVCTALATGESISNVSAG